MNRNPLKFQRKEGIKKIEKVVGGVYYIWQTDRLQPPPITGGKKKKKRIAYIEWGAIETIKIWWGVEQLERKAAI